MMRLDYIFGGYIHSESFFHHADPRIKLLYTLYGMIVLFLIHSLVSFAFMGITIFMLFFYSKIGVIYAIKALKTIWLLVLLAFLFQLFNPSGKVIADFGVLLITSEALRRAFIIVIRLCLLIWLSLLLTATTSPMSIADSMESLLKKMGLKKSFAHEISMIMSLAIRFLPIISTEANQIVRAQSARGASFEDKNPFKRMKALFPVIIPLLVSSFKRADEIALAMDVRYYNGFRGRTKFMELKIKQTDLLLFTMATGTFTFTLIFDKVIIFV